MWWYFRLSTTFDDCDDATPHVDAPDVADWWTTTTTYSLLFRVVVENRKKSDENEEEHF